MHWAECPGYKHAPWWLCTAWIALPSVGSRFVDCCSPRKRQRRIVWSFFNRRWVFYIALLRSDFMLVESLETARIYSNSALERSFIEAGRSTVYHLLPILDSSFGRITAYREITLQVLTIWLLTPV
jgi:hypothetical protein